MNLLKVMFRHLLQLIVHLIQIKFRFFSEKDKCQI